MALIAPPVQLFAEVVKATSAAPNAPLSVDITTIMNAACAALDSALVERIVATGADQHTLYELHREWEDLRQASPDMRARRALLIILRMNAIGGRVREILDTPIDPTAPAEKKLIILG